MKRPGLKRVYLTQTELVAAEAALEYAYDMALDSGRVRDDTFKQALTSMKDAQVMFKSFVRAGEQGLLPGPPDGEKETVYPYGRRVWVQLTTIAISLTGILGLTIAGYFV